MHTTEPIFAGHFGRRRSCIPLCLGDGRASLVKLRGFTMRIEFVNQMLQFLQQLRSRDCQASVGLHLLKRWRWVALRWAVVLETSNQHVTGTNEDFGSHEVSRLARHFMQIATIRSERVNRPRRGGVFHLEPPFQRTSALVARRHIMPRRLLWNHSRASGSREGGWIDCSFVVFMSCVLSRWLLATSHSLDRSQGRGRESGNAFLAPLAQRIHSLRSC